MRLLRRTVPLDDRLTALAEAAQAARGRLPDHVVERARTVAERAGERRGLSVEHTVVALAGATGGGKSSLFNLLTGARLAEVGVTRPTTATARAAVWDGAGAGPLLDWLGVAHRHEIAGEPSGLVLLDLPDHDSIEVSHRLEADRLVELVDLLVWVVDPQKYADAVLHERYLRRLARHGDVTLVVLNQVDRLAPSAVERCLADLRRLLDADGLSQAPVLASRPAPERASPSCARRWSTGWRAAAPGRPGSPRTPPPPPPLSPGPRRAPGAAPPTTSTRSCHRTAGGSSGWRNPSPPR